MTAVATCTHKQATHQHGTHAAYVLDRCRCDDCREANRAYATTLRRTNLYGRQRLVDATPAREHLLALSRAGMGWKVAAAAAGVPNSTVGGILFGAHPDDPTHHDHRPPRQRINRDAEARILAVRVQLADGAQVDATGTRRRLQALVTLGYPISTLGTMLGKTSANMFTTLDSPRVLEVTRRRVVALYDALWDTHPPETTRHERTSATRARNYARRHGWAPPLAWDDEDLDDPSAQPQGVATSPVRVTIAAHAAELLEIGYSVTEIPHLVGQRDLNHVIWAIRDPALRAELKRRAS